MTELVLQPAGTKLTGTETLLSHLKVKFLQLINKKITKSELFFLGTTLALLQVLDGILTGIGVVTISHDLEANLFIRYLITHLGVAPALIAVKLFAIVIIGVLCSMVNKVSWLASVLEFIVILYLFAAIVPWTMMLVFNFA